MHLFQFIGALLGSAVVVASASIVWPLVTSKAMPPALESVREVVIETPIGQQASQVLGVSDPEKVTPVNIPELVVYKASEAILVAEGAIKNVATTTIVTQLVERFKDLPDDQKQAVRVSICAPPVVE